MAKPLEFREFPAQLAAIAAFGPYRAFVTDVVDGDTYGVLVSPGFDEYRYTRIRLWGLDTPEIFSPLTATEKERGLAAKARAQTLIERKHVVLYTDKDLQTLGRFIAKVMFVGADGLIVSLADVLRSEGFEK